MFKISTEPIDAAALRKAVGDRDAGAFVAFEGWVRIRNEGRAVQRLQYEAHASLAEKEGNRILAEARAKFSVLGAVAVHRTGTLAIGDLAVWVGVTAEHRDAAFAAARYVIDEVKARVPVWKKEHYEDGTTEWINCATRGDFAAGQAPRGKT